VSEGRESCQWALAAEFLKDEWREHLSENFRLLTDVETATAVERIHELEMFRSVVLRITGAQVQPASDRGRRARAQMMAY
jgi:hypothetical protein